MLPSNLIHEFVVYVPLDRLSYTAKKCITKEPISLDDAYNLISLVPGSRLGFFLPDNVALVDIHCREFDNSAQIQEILDKFPTFGGLMETGDIRLFMFFDKKRGMTNKAVTRGGVSFHVPEPGRSRSIIDVPLEHLDFTPTHCVNCDSALFELYEQKFAPRRGSRHFARERTLDLANVEDALEREALIKMYAKHFEENPGSTKIPLGPVQRYKDMDDVYAYIKQHGTCTPNDLVKDLGLLKHRAVNALQRLVKSAAIMKKSYGVYGFRSEQKPVSKPATKEVIDWS